MLQLQLRITALLVLLYVVLPRSTTVALVALLLPTSSTLTVVYRQVQPAVLVLVVLVRTDAAAL